ncbi:hypothetical protein [Aquimarina intermedia]|uniref:DUF4468 domain-containing protein n=1 Tax=Aquimarina intermedia TaxID=350814 RepID=A0A5S5BZN3_9FLAO|nr:hypothetical protein [Aquimarina intermedia]TYP71530.1 hypothetical protein BD809_109112 [Aquimarina intermedia]
MKRKLLLLLFFIGASIQAQEKVNELRITPEGFNGFLVKQFEGKTAEELYQAVTKWSEYNINNASVSNQSNIENEYLSYNVMYKSGLFIRSGLAKLVWDPMFKVEFRFKDGKVRYDIKIISMNMHPNYGGKYPQAMIFRGGMLAYSFFNKKGKPKANTEQARNQIEDIANSIIGSVSDHINGESENTKSDW